MFVVFMGGTREAYGRHMGGTLGVIVIRKCNPCNALWFFGSDGSHFMLYPPNNVYRSLSIVVNCYG